MIIPEGSLFRPHRHFAATAVAALCAALCLPYAPALHAQDGGGGAAAQRSGLLPDASFETAFRKYVAGEQTFSPFYSWDAWMALDLELLRKGRNGLAFKGVFQTVGTENLGTKISVGGTGYILRLEYVRRYGDEASMSAGISHLSSHLTRDLDDKTDEERARRATIPRSRDASEYNALFLKGRLKRPAWRFAPEFEAVVQPINIRLDGRAGRYVRPLCLGSQWRLWRGGRRSVALETQHEIGRNPLNYMSLAFELHGRNASDGGRLAIFAAGSIGHTLHVSPNAGAMRDGLVLGIRLRFHD